LIYFLADFGSEFADFIAGEASDGSEVNGARNVGCWLGSRGSRFEQGLGLRVGDEKVGFGLGEAGLRGGGGPDREERGSRPRESYA
jgi:hypothetical protein